ncbi:putative bifunctional diguanylate cyclase/phosphodiesterase [Actinoplanes sp. GCM10030250]|uniref:putative bifunctional diguanylate cyclase/phosphodiesterase n=1 Tax=Actinoplanes sp. GCM10030250 TaxID=3273376 RepID=UPI003607C1C3
MRFGRVPLWAGWLLVAATAALCFPLVPDDSLPAKIYVNTIGSSATIATIIGILRNRPEHRGAWLLFALGMGTLVSGDITYDIIEYTTGEYPYPYYADALYLSAYPLLWAGILRLGRGSGKRDRGGVLDAAVISVGVALVYWVFVVGPTLQDSGAPWLERLVTIGYPLSDVLLTSAVARMLFRSENRTPSLRLLAVGSSLLLTGDLFYTVMSTSAEYTGGLIDSGFLLAYSCWAAASLHPSMRHRPDTRAASHRVGGRRLALLAVATLLAPAMLFWQGSSGENIAWAAIGAGAVALFLLVVSRMWGFVKQVEVQAGRLEDLAMRDELTGLANRRRFVGRLAEAVTAGRPHVLLLDLDGFKAVNDKYGHGVGDDLLVEIAGRLAAEVPATALVARMGGDEFAVLVPEEYPAGGCDELAVRLRAAVHRPVRAGGNELLVGTSIGIADGSDLDGTGTAEPGEVLRRADVAMYASKAGGGRPRRYSPELDDQAGEESRLAADLRIALDRGEFHLVYQPIVELPHARVLAVESLIRWCHPDHGYIGPDRFIPVAERNGLIVELGEWILRTACAQYTAWQRQGVAPARIGVNVSARQLAEPGFVDLVAAVLTETGMHPRHLIVEVTETAVFGGGAAVRTVHGLTALGVDIALDDFGTGHSSLGLLQTLPVSILKVDKSFVENVTMAGRHAVIATSLIQVAHGLGLLAVAEGVETAEQAAELYRLGYRRAQGYHFGRPAAVPDFAVLANQAA